MNTCECMVMAMCTNVVLMVYISLYILKLTSALASRSFRFMSPLMREFQLELLPALLMVGRASFASSTSLEEAVFRRSQDIFEDLKSGTKFTNY